LRAIAGPFAFALAREQSVKTSAQSIAALADLPGAPVADRAFRRQAGPDAT
jgi:hypothetical protein